MQRVIAYIDGFNLYYGLRSKEWGRYKWLNIQLLMQNLLKPHQHLDMTKYFTAQLLSPANTHQQQSTYLEALGTLPDLSIYYGYYQLDPRTCPHCGVQDTVPHEKMTDVNIAVELLSDAFQDKFDVALLLSADSDLIARLEAIRRLFPDKRVVVAFPPKRHSKQLRTVAHACFTIGRAKFAQSLFPPEVRKPDGFVLRCPPTWR